jgi:Na+-transporting NADH:ubiquinone oxidoreductase subunit NqrF
MENEESRIGCSYYRSKRSWQGDRGLINKEMVEKYLKGAASPIYYIAGLPATVAALHKTFQEAGINDDDIRKEEFTGY